VTALEILGPSPGSVEARASFALKVLAGLNIGVVVLSLIPSPDPQSWLQAATFNSTIALAAGLYIVEAVGLDRRWPWASAAVRPMIAVTGLIGLYALADVVAAGRLRVPTDVILAAWVWLGPADARSAPRRDGRTVALVGATLAVLAMPLTGPSVVGWGGLLDVHQPDLEETLRADCGDAAEGPPSTITVTYDWSWRRGGVFPSGTDVVVIGWTGDARLDPVLYLLGNTPEAGTGIVSGRQVDPSAEMARAVEAESRISWHWGIDLGAQQLRPGRIEFELDRMRPPPAEGGVLSISATYVHLGLWREDAAGVICAW
jgi:hypothetical protein